jgi:hypothetical protein
MVNFSLPCQSDDTAGDAPYVELVKQAEQLLQEGAMAVNRQAWREPASNSEVPVVFSLRSQCDEDADSFPGGARCGDDAAVMARRPLASRQHISSSHWAASHSATFRS